MNLIFTGLGNAHAIEVDLAAAHHQHRPLADPDRRVALSAVHLLVDQFDGDDRRGAAHRPAALRWHLQRHQSRPQLLLCPRLHASLCLVPRFARSHGNRRLPLAAMPRT